MEENEIASAVKKLIVIGGSAGSLGVILNHIHLLDASLPVAVILVLHRKANGESLLEELLMPRTGMKVKEAEDKEPILDRNIYIAPADYHLLIEKEHSLALDYSERLNYSRPCIDATFETAADVYGKNLIAVILSGANADGVEGLKVVKTHGGITIAQNPADAAVPYMPQQAIKDVEIDYTTNGDELMQLLNKLVAQ